MNRVIDREKGIFLGSGGEGSGLGGKRFVDSNVELVGAFTVGLTIGRFTPANGTGNGVLNLSAGLIDVGCSDILEVPCRPLVIVDDSSIDHSLAVNGNRASKESHILELHLVILTHRDGHRFTLNLLDDTQGILLNLVDEASLRRWLTKSDTRELRVKPLDGAEGVGGDLDIAGSEEIGVVQIHRGSTVDLANGLGLSRILRIHDIGIDGIGETALLRNTNHALDGGRVGDGSPEGSGIGNIESDGGSAKCVDVGDTLGARIFTSGKLDVQISLDRGIRFRSLGDSTEGENDGNVEAADEFGEFHDEEMQIVGDDRTLFGIFRRRRRIISGRIVRAGDGIDNEEDHADDGEGDDLEFHDEEMNRLLLGVRSEIESETSRRGFILGRLDIDGANRGISDLLGSGLLLIGEGELEIGNGRVETLLH